MSYFSQNPRYCIECRKAKKACVCADLIPFNNDQLPTHFWVHPKERERSRSTSWLAHKLLEHSSYRIDGEHQPPTGNLALLFPSENALPWSQVPFDGLVVVDGTWDECRAMIRKTPFLKSLPTITFEQPYLGQYIARRSPRPGALCTAEAVGHLFLEMGNSDGTHLLNLVETLNARERFFLSRPAGLT